MVMIVFNCFLLLLSAFIVVDGWQQRIIMETICTFLLFLLFSSMHLQQHTSTRTAQLPPAPTPL